MTMPPRGHLEVVLDARAELGEGPWWDVRTQRLLWIDLYPGMIHSFDPRSGLDIAFSVGQPVGMVAGRMDGGVIAAVRDGLVAADLDTGESELVLRVETDVHENRANDGKCDAAGRLWWGTMAFDQTPDAGTVYRVDADMSPQAVIAATTTSNGIDWSPDDRLMYHADTATGIVSVYDFDLERGVVSAGRPLFAAGPGQGAPDGLTVDADGDIWVAMWDGWSVLRLAPDGSLKDVIDVPTARPTSVAFGGADLTDLFITSARFGRTPEQLRDEPHAGSIFRCRPGVTGRAFHPFAG